MSNVFVTFVALFNIASSVIFSDPVERILQDGASTRSKVTVCVGIGGAARRCEGVVVRRALVLARNSCVGDQPLHALTVLEINDWWGCKGLTVSEKEYLEVTHLRKPLVRYVHPHHTQEENDLCLLLINQPYTKPKTVHITETSTQTNRYLEWIDGVESLNDHNSSETLTKRKTNMKAHAPNIFSSPKEMFFITVILPSLGFALFFTCFICYSRNRPSVTYDQIKECSNDKVDNDKPNKASLLT